MGDARRSSTDVRRAIVELEGFELDELLRLLKSAIRVQQAGSDTHRLEQSLKIQLQSARATLPA